MISGLLSSSN